MSVSRFSRVIQSLRAVFTSDADSSLISAAVGDDGDEVGGEPAVHAAAESGLRVSQAPVPVEQEFLVAGQLVLVPGQHALQRDVG